MTRASRRARAAASHHPRTRSSRLARILAHLTGQEA